MKAKIWFVIALGLALGSVSAMTQDTNSPPSAGQNQGPQDGGGRRGGYGGGMMGRGVMGTVTEVAADHFTVKNEAGEVYTIHFSTNTRMIKQPAQRQDRGQNQGGERTPPQAIKASDIKVGDAIGATGEIDTTAKSVGAVMVMQIDPERAKQMREMQANYGKTWLMGKVTAVKDTQVTLQSQVDNAAHSFVADENTTFRKRRDPITLADVAVGDNVRVEGAVKEGVFVAATVSVMGPQAMGGPQPRRGEPPQ